MGCLIALFSLIGPRVALAFTWIFTVYVDRAYDNAIVPVIGFVVLPWTTLVYALVYAPVAGVNSLGWVLVALGLMAGGFIGGITRSADVAISEATRADLSTLGLTDFSGLVPAELFSWEALATVPGAILIVGGGLEAVPGIERVKRLGVRVVVSDGSFSAPGLRPADDRILVSTYDIGGTVDAAANYHLRRALDGVMSIAADVPLTVARVAEAPDLAEVARLLLCEDVEGGSS